MRQCVINKILIMKSLNTFYNVKISNILFFNETDGILHLHIKVALFHIYDVLLVSIISMFYTRTQNTLTHLKSRYFSDLLCHYKTVTLHIKRYKNQLTRRY